MTPLTQAYADFAATAATLAPPDEALHTATTGFVDAIGVTESLHAVSVRLTTNITNSHESELWFR